MTEGADLNDPRLLRRSTYGRASSKARSSGLSRHAYNAEEGELQELAKSEMSYEMLDNPEIKSDIQEGRMSEVAKSIRSPSVHPGPVDPVRHYYLMHNMLLTFVLGDSGT